jgi:Integrase core domain/GAG-pre-integrase domain
VKFLQKNGKLEMVEDAYYIPEIKNNILSVGQLMEKGFKIFMKKKTLHLKDSRGRAIARVEMGENRMFKLNLQRIEQKCLKINKEDEAWLWHIRFGHLGYSGLRDLLKKQSVQGLLNLDFENKFCEGCVIGKQTRRQFGKSKFSATRPLELIHTDICGPITPGSFNRKEYFITFIDDCSRKCWVYFIEKKSEAFETFKKFKIMVEKTTGKNIQSLRSDRGGEYLSNQFKLYCENQRIRRFFTIPYTPQQNGIAERKKQDNPRYGEINDQNQRNAEGILGRSCACAVYIQNRCPHAFLNNRILQEL